MSPPCPMELRVIARSPQSCSIIYPEHPWDISLEWGPGGEQGSLAVLGVMGAGGQPEWGEGSTCLGKGPPTPGT